MRLIACLAVTMLTACASVPASQPAPAPATRLISAGAEVKSWGATLRQWTIDSEGRVEHTSGEKVGANRNDIIIEVRRLTLSADGRQKLADAVQRVETVLATPEQCDEQLTDGPYGSFRWNSGRGEQTLKFDGNCMKGRDYELASAIFAADKIVDDAAKAVGPAERRPLGETR